MHYPRRPVILRGSSWNLMGQLVPAIISIGLTPFLIHRLGLPRYSLFSLVQTSALFLTSFDGGFASTAGRYFATHVSRGDSGTVTRLLATFILIMLALGAIFTAALLLFSHTLISLFNIPHTLQSQATFLVRILGIIVTTALVQSVLIALVQAHHRYALASIAGGVGSLFWACGAVYATLSGAGLKGLGVAIVGQQLVVILVVAPVTLTRLNLFGIRLVPLRDLREMFAFSVRRQLFGITNLVNNQVDVFVIAAVLPLRTVGLYTTGANLALQLRGVLSNALVPMGNDITYVYGREGEEAARRRFIQLQGVWMVAVTGYFAVALGAVYYATEAWLGAPYRVAGLVASVLLIGHAINMCTGPLTLYLNAIGKPGAEARYGVIAMILNVVLTIPLVFLGLFGVVGGTVGGMVVGCLLLVPLARRSLGTPIPHFLRSLRPLPGVAAGAAAFLTLWATRTVVPGGPLGLIVAGVLSLPALALYALLEIGPRRGWISVRTVVLRVFEHL